MLHNFLLFGTTANENRSSVILDWFTFEGNPELFVTKCKYHRKFKVGLKKWAIYEFFVHDYYHFSHNSFQSFKLSINLHALSF